MAEKTPGLDPSNINYYGADPADTQAYQDALQASVTALEQRYANPNWFNVAAGFFKPQLGGFAASLGSASQALGENVEKQRESALPLAQMRAQLAASKIAMGQRSSVANLMANRKPGDPLTPEFVADITARAPGSSVALALKDQLATQQAQRSLASSEQGNAMQRVQMARSMGQEPNPADLALIAGSSPTLKPSAAAPAEAGAPSAVPSPAAPVAPEAPMPYTGSALPPDTLANLKNKAATGDAEAVDALRAYQEAMAPKAAAPAKDEGYLPRTLKAAANKDIPAPMQQQALSSSTIKEAEALEKTSIERLNALTTFTAPENLPVMRNATKTAIAMMRDDPQRAGRVLNLVRGSGPFAAAFNAGANAQLSSGLGSVGGTLSFPVEAMIKAGLSENDQAYSDKLANSLMVLRAAGLKLSSVSPTALVNHPSGLGTVQSMNFNMDQTPQALFNGLQHFEIMQDFLEQYTNAYNSELQRADPTSLTKTTDAFRSTKLRDLASSYEKVHGALDKNYASGLAKRKQ